MSSLAQQPEAARARAIEGAQTAETRQRRLAKTLDELHLRA